MHVISCVFSYAQVGVGLTCACHFVRVFHTHRWGRWNGRPVHVIFAAFRYAQVPIRTGGPQLLRQLRQRFEHAALDGIARVGRGRACVAWAARPQRCTALYSRQQHAQAQTWRDRVRGRSGTSPNIQHSPNPPPTSSCWIGLRRQTKRLSWLPHLAARHQRVR